MKTLEQTAFSFGATVRENLFERDVPVHDWERRLAEQNAAAAKARAEAALGTDEKGQKKLAQQQRRDARKPVEIILTVPSDEGDT
jgi:hypothetical protein